MQPTSTKQLG